MFQIPIEEEFGWPRSEFSLAIAIQNLAWGFGAPFFGAFAEKLGGSQGHCSGGRALRGWPCPYDQCHLSAGHTAVRGSGGIRNCGNGVRGRSRSRREGQQARAQGNEPGDRHRFRLSRPDSRADRRGFPSEEHELAIRLHDLRRFLSSSFWVCSR